jgi:hypothetical protein
LAARVFELSQTIRQQWLTADYPVKRRLLEIVFLNSRLDGATLVPEMRKPFDVLAEGLPVQWSRGDWIRTSDLLNSIQELAGRKIARASRFTEYRSHNSRMLRGGSHNLHDVQGVSCTFVHFFLQPIGGAWPALAAPRPVLPLAHLPGQAFAGAARWPRRIAHYKVIAEAAGKTGPAVLAPNGFSGPDG